MGFNPLASLSLFVHADCESDICQVQDLCTCIKEKFGHRARYTENHVNTKAEIQAMHLQAEECQSVSEPADLGEAQRQVLPQPSEGTKAINPLTGISGLHNWEITHFCHLSHFSSKYFVTT